MKIINLTIFTLLLENFKETLSQFVTNNTSISKNEINYRLPNNVIPIHYNVGLISNIAIGDFAFSGTTSTVIKVRNSTSDIVLNSLNLTIDESYSNLEKVDGRIYLPNEHLYDNETQMLTIAFDENIVPGSYILHLRFSGFLADDLRGFYRSYYINDQGNTVWLAITHFQPSMARRAFPCWDEPALKATFKISIKHHRNYTALSNMPFLEQSLVDEIDDKIWSYFDTSPIMSAHILAFIISDFVNISTVDGSVRVWCKKSDLTRVHYVFNISQTIAIALEGYTNITSKVPKMDHVGVPQYSSTASENWGLITYIDTAILYDKDENTAMNKLRQTMLVTHELTHQWFGNLVTPKWWKYMWLSEGFAVFFEHYMVDKLFPDLRLMDTFVITILQRITLATDVCPYTYPMNINVSSPREIPSIYNRITYRKASSVIRMLLHCVSEEVFHAGLLKYLNANEFKAVTPDNLWESIQISLNESNVPHNDFKIKDVMDTWIEQKGYPTVIITRNYETGTLKISQQIFTSSTDQINECNNKWWIPLNFVTQENPDFSSTLPTHWMSSQDKSKTVEGFDPHGWIIVNKQQTGIYRVYYDIENWRRIAQYINSDNFTKIHVLNRAQIINDAYIAMSTKRLDPDTFMAVINYLSRETDHIPWRAANDILMEWLHIFTIPQADILKSYILNLMSNIVKKLGYDERSEDNDLTKMERRIIMRWACIFDEPNCLINSTSKLIAYLEDPEHNKISPNLMSVIMCAGLKNANETTWNKVLEIYKRKPSFDTLKYLSCSKNEVIFEKYLNMTISENSPILKNHSKILLKDILIDNFNHLDLILDFFDKNLDRIFPKFQNEDEIIDRVIYAVNTHNQLDKAKGILKSKGKFVNEETIIHVELKLARIHADLIFLRNWIKREVPHLLA